MFQSLFFWMMHIGIQSEYAQCGPGDVSILVLLDDAHRVDNYLFNEYDTRCFNPCSSG